MIGAVGTAVERSVSWGGSPTRPWLPHLQTPHGPCQSFSLQGAACSTAPPSLPARPLCLPAPLPVRVAYPAAFLSPAALPAPNSPAFPRIFPAFSLLWGRKGPPQPVHRPPGHAGGRSLKALPSVGGAEFDANSNTS